MSALSRQPENNLIQGFALMRCVFLGRDDDVDPPQDDPQSFTSSAICVTLLYKAYFLNQACALFLSLFLSFFHLPP